MGRCLSPQIEQREDSDLPGDPEEFQCGPDVKGFIEEIRVEKEKVRTQRDAERAGAKGK